MVELLAIVAVVIILGVVFLPVVAGCGGSNRKAPRIKCVSNLKNIGLAFRIFATDNNDLFPSGLLLICCTLPSPIKTFPCSLCISLVQASGRFVVRTKSPDFTATPFV